jgi:hypothetical protein
MINIDKSILCFKIRGGSLKGMIMKIKLFPPTKNNSFALCKWRGISLDNQLKKSWVVAGPEIYHYEGWRNYYQDPTTRVSFLKVSQPATIFTIVKLLSGEGYRSATLQELLLAIEGRDVSRLPQKIILPELPWSKMKKETKYIVLEQGVKVWWELYTAPIRKRVDSNYRVACVKK